MNSSTGHIIRVTWLSNVFVFGALGNLLLFAVILRKGRIANVANLFNLNLAVGDVLRIIVFVPVYLDYSSQGEWPRLLGSAGCKGIFMIVQSSLTVSIITLMLMSLDRFQAVVHPLKKQMTINIAKGAVVLSWVLGLLTSVWFALSIDTKIDDKRSCGVVATDFWIKVTLLLLIIGTQWLPGVFFTVAYIKIILKLRRDSVINPSDVSQSSQNRHRRNKRAARILVIEVLLFLCFLYPFYQHSLAWILGSDDIVSPLSVKGTLIFCMMMSYSLINPICHIALNSEFRAEIFRMICQFKGCCCRAKTRPSSCSQCHVRPWHENQQGTHHAAERTKTTTGI